MEEKIKHNTQENTNKKDIVKTSDSSKKTSIDENKIKDLQPDNKLKTDKILEEKIKHNTQENTNKNKEDTNKKDIIKTSNNSNQELTKDNSNNSKESAYISMHSSDKPISSNARDNNSIDKITLLKNKVANKHAVVNKILNNNDVHNSDSQINQTVSSLSKSLDIRTKTNDSKLDLTSFTQKIVKRLITLMKNKFIKISVIFSVFIILLYCTYVTIDSYTYKKYGTPILQTPKIANLIKTIKNSFSKAPSTIVTDNIYDKEPKIIENRSVDIRKNNNNLSKENNNNQQILPNRDLIKISKAYENLLLENKNLIEQYNKKEKELYDLQIKLTTYKFIIESIESGYKRAEIKNTLLNQGINIGPYLMKILNKYNLEVNNNISNNINATNSSKEPKNILKNFINDSNNNIEIINSKILLSVLLYIIRGKVTNNEDFNYDSYLMLEIAEKIANPEITQLVNKIAHHSDITYHSASLFTKDTLLRLYKTAKKKAINDFYKLKYGTILGKIKAFISNNFYIIHLNENYKDKNDNLKQYYFYLYKIKTLIETNQFIKANYYIEKLDSDIFNSFNELKYRLNTYKSLIDNLDALIKILAATNKQE